MIERRGSTLAVRRRAVSFIAMAFVVPGMAAAEEPNPVGPALSLNQAVSRAVSHNKQLAAFEHRKAEQAGRVEQAGLIPNPTARLTVEDAAGSGVYEGFDSAQTTLSLEWVLERTIRRRRVAAAEVGSALVLTDAEILRLDVAAEAAQRFLNSLANQVRRENADEAVEIAENAVAVVRRRVKAGRAPRGELSRAEAELASAKLSRDDIGHELLVAYHRLAAQLGEVEPEFSRVLGNLLELPVPAPYLEYLSRVRENPRLVRFVTQERLAKANLRLAEAKRWPTLRPSVGVRRLETTNDFALVAEVSVPLPLFSRNQGQVSTSRAALSRTRADGEAEYVRVRTALFEVYEELEHHIHRASTLREEVIPRLAKALSETRLGYEKGRYSYLEFRSLQAELLDARNELVEASTGAHRLVIVLERLTGERVAES